MSCVFCEIIAKTSPANIIFENDELIVFTTIRPASDIHYLVVPKSHIIGPSHVNESHSELVSQMVQVAKRLLIDDKHFEETQIRLGFHWPPFNSINHLHLHAIAPVSQMSFVSKLLFRPNTFWFSTIEAVLVVLVKRGSKLTV